MSIKVSGGGGGGGLPPGVTGDGQTPGGVIIAGALQAGNSAATVTPTFHSIYGQITVTGDQANLDDGDNTLEVFQGGTLSGNTSRPVVLLQRAVDENGHALTGPVLLIDDFNAHSGAVSIRLAGILPGTSTVDTVLRVNNNGGIGLFGVTPPTAPRTLAQSAITAITDANARTAVQAIADTLADMGALTIT